jgi:hypothetical protein
VRGKEEKRIIIIIIIILEYRERASKNYRTTVRTEREKKQSAGVENEKPN